MTALQWLFLAVFLQVLLAFSVLMLLATRRRAAFKAGEVGRRAIIDDREWPDSVLKVSNNYKSQFEWPIVFYAVAALVVAMGAVTKAQSVLAIAFVLSRFWHTINQVGANRLPGRFLAFLAGVIIVMVMWVLLAIHVFTGS